RALDPYDLRRLAHGFPHEAEVAHVHRRHRDAELFVHALVEAIRPPVDVVAEDDVVAGLQEMRDRVGPGHARREREAPLPIFELGQARLERGARGIARARVVVALVLSDRLLHEGRGLEDRDLHAAGHSFGLLARVDRERLEARSARGGLWHRTQYARALVGGLEANGRAEDLGSLHRAERRALRVLLLESERRRFDRSLVDGRNSAHRDRASAHDDRAGPRDELAVPARLWSEVTPHKDRAAIDDEPDRHAVHRALGGPRLDVDLQRLVEELADVLRKAHRRTVSEAAREVNRRYARA